MSDEPEKLMIKLGIDYYLIILLFLSLMMAAPLVGRISAKTQKKFLTIKSNPELVMLRKYSDRLICFEFDKEKKELTDKFYVIALDKISNERIQLVYEKLGTLRPSQRHQK